MEQSNRTLALWRKCTRWPAGAWLFSTLLCLKAPYFATIRPRVEILEPGRCRVRIRKRRRVQNHIGTVHAIAICNMAELAAGVMTDATMPASHRWIPRGMTVDYLNKADSQLTAEAVLEALPAFDEESFDLVVPVSVRDANGDEVVHARITMWISPKKKRAR